MSLFIPKGLSHNQLSEIITEAIAEVLSEKELTQGELDKQERIVKTLKTKYPEFKQKYGKRAKQVMYALATKMAEKK